MPEADHWRSSPLGQLLGQRCAFAVDYGAGYCSNLGFLTPIDPLLGKFIAAD